MESEQASPHCQETFFKLKLLITLYPPKEKKQNHNLFLF